MKILVLNTRDRRVRADVSRLARALNRGGRLTGPTRRSAVNVVLVNDRRIRDLNRRFRKRDRPTDVLSFPLDAVDPDSAEAVLGEVYVSRDRARAQARENGVTYHNEVKRLMLHGILHLLGLTHREMEEWYERYLQ